MNDSDKRMDSQDPDSHNFGSLFVQLVLSFHAAAWQQMGKVVSVVSGKLERDLKMAKHSIDMLGMLAEKTKGNLAEDEKKYIDQALYELRMNYLEEQKKETADKENETQDNKEDGENKTSPEGQNSDNE